MSTLRQQQAIKRVKDSISKDCPYLKTENFDHKNETVYFDYTCTKCNTSETNIPFKNFRSRKAKCKVCDKVTVGTKPLSVDHFKEVLIRNGWKYDDENSAYKNTKSLCYVLTNEGERVKTTCARFKAGHRSKSQTDKAQTTPYEDVVKKFSEKGFELLEKDYINNKTPMLYKCRCGEISKIALVNLYKNISGCMICTRKSKSAWKKIIDTFEHEKCTLITAEDKYLGNNSKLKYICSCGNEGFTSWKTFSKGSRCKVCKFEKRAQTCLEKYGVENVFQSPEIKEQIRNYYLEKFGVRHNMQIEECKRKAKETCLKNFGVECVLTTPEVRQSAIQTHIEKYGAAPGSSLEIREKQKASNKANLGVDFPLESEEIQKKIKALNLEKYGNEMFIQSDTGKKLMLEKYGAENAMQVPELFQKAMKNAFRFKDYTFPSGRVEKVQGYEGYAIDYFINKFGIDEDDIVVEILEIPTVQYDFDGVKNRKYFPDIFYKPESTLIEVKSVYTFNKDYDKNIAKWKAAVEDYTFCIIVMNKNKLVKYWYIEQGCWETPTLDKE